MGRDILKKRLASSRERNATVVLIQPIQVLDTKYYVIHNPDTTPSQFSKVFGVCSDTSQTKAALTEATSLAASASRTQHRIFAFHGNSQRLFL